jgi:hypothetical protein
MFHLYFDNIDNRNEWKPVFDIKTDIEFEKRFFEIILNEMIL